MSAAPSRPESLVHAAASLLPDIGPIGVALAACPAHGRVRLTPKVRNVTCPDCLEALIEERESQ